MRSKINYHIKYMWTQWDLYIYVFFLCPPWKRGHIVLQLSVGRSVCRPSGVRSISFDPFTWSIPNLVQRLPSIRRWSLLIFRSHVQRSRSNHSSKSTVLSAQYLWPLHLINTFTWSIPNFVQGLRPISRWSLLIFRSHIQRSRTNHSFESSVLSTLYILIPCLLASDRFCFYREDKPEFCTMESIYVSETFLVKLDIWTIQLSEMSGNIKFLKGFIALQLPDVYCNQIVINSNHHHGWLLYTDSVIMFVVKRSMTNVNYVYFYI